MAPKRAPPPPPPAGAPPAPKRPRTSPASAKGKAPAASDGEAEACPENMPDPADLARLATTQEAAADALRRLYALDPHAKSRLAVQRAKLSGKKYAAVINGIVLSIDSLAPPQPKGAHRNTSDPRLAGYDDDTYELVKQLHRQGVTWRQAADVCEQLRSRRRREGRDLRLHVGTDFDEALGEAFQVVDLTGMGASASAAPPPPPPEQDDGEPPPPKTAQEEELLRQEARHLEEAMRVSLEEVEAAKVARRKSVPSKAPAEVVEDMAACGTYASLQGADEGAGSKLVAWCKLSCAERLAKSVIALAKFERNCTNWYPTVRHGIGAHFHKLGLDAALELGSVCPHGLDPATSDRSAQTTVDKAADAFDRALHEVNVCVAKLPATSGELPAAFTGHPDDAVADVALDDKDGVIVID